MKTATKAVIFSVVAAQLACGPEKKAKKQDALPEEPTGEVSLPPARPLPPPVATSGIAQVFVSTGKKAWINPDTGVSWSLGMHVVNDRVLYDESTKEGLLGFSASLVERNTLGNLDVSGYRMANYCGSTSYLFTRENFGVYARGSEWDMREARVFLKAGDRTVEVGRFQKPDPNMTEYSKMLLSDQPVICEEEYASTCRLVTVLHGRIRDPVRRNHEVQHSPFQDHVITHGDIKPVGMTPKNNRLAHNMLGRSARVFRPVRPGIEDDTQTEQVRRDFD